jgi:hypothetical protein
MMGRRAGPFLLLGLIVAFLGIVGCAALSGGSSAGEGTASGAEPRAEARAEAMTPARMELIFASQVSAIEGPTGAIRTRIDGINIYLISDPANDRMRIMAQIAFLEGLDPRILSVLLEANFHDTLDARYAISGGVIYSIFLHPISSLTPELIRSGLAQVVSLAQTFGTDFTSGKLHFRGRGVGVR